MEVKTGAKLEGWFQTVNSFYYYTSDFIFYWYTSDFIFYWYFGWLIIWRGENQGLTFFCPNFAEPRLPEPGKFRLYNIVNSWKIPIWITKIAKVFKKGSQLDQWLKWRFSSFVEFSIGKPIKLHPRIWS